MSDKQTQDELKASLNKIWLAGLGALQVAEEESSKLFTNLVEKGKEYETKGRAQAKEVSSEIKTKVEEAAQKVRGEATGTYEKFEDRIDAVMTSSLGRLGVPSRDEIATLTQRVEELTRVVEQLKTPAPAKKAPAAKKAAPRKTAPRKTTAKKAAPKADAAETEAN